MDLIISVVISAIIVLVLTIIAMYFWYNFTGWQQFSFQTGDNAGWTSTSTASALRFKDCIFSVNRSDGVNMTLDVTANLNAMAVGLQGLTTSELKLSRPLNPFSFTIMGFNDKNTVSDPTVYPWCSAPPASCTSDSTCPFGDKNGACSDGKCVNCPGGATVSLIGSFRII